MSVNQNVSNVTNMKKEFIFKSVNSGTSKKNGRPFVMVELHDPQTLENTSFFIPDGRHIETSQIVFKDNVIAELSMDFAYGRPQLNLIGLELKK